MRTLAAVLVLFAAPLLLADLAPVVDQARKEKKLLLIYYRAADAKANEKADPVMDEGFADEVTKRALDAYVPLRVVDGEEKHPILDDIAKKHKGPLVAIYDPSGTRIVLIEKVHLGWNRIGEVLLRVRANRDGFIRASELRDSGETASAEFQLGTAFFAAGLPYGAGEHLDKASALLKQKGHLAAHQLAEIYAGSSWYSAGAKSRGRVQIANVIRNPMSDEIAAEAWLARGHIDRADKNIGTAVQSYRKAYDLAAVGSSTLEAVKIALSQIDERPLPPKQAMKSTVKLIPPARTTVVGDAEFLVQAEGDIARVELWLDDAKAVTLDKPPFRTNIDVGKTPRLRTVKAIAFDSKGKAVGESVATINDRVDVFRLAITSPATQRIEESATIEIDARVPPQRRLKQIDVYWNDEKLGTLTAAPYRQRVDAKGAFGYVRAVGVLDDGTTVEETRIYNAEGMSASVDVATVTLIASVLDRDGKPVKALKSADFAVEDEGKRVAATLQSSDDEPVTIGLAIDSSGSMVGRQLYVTKAAGEFLARALRPVDEAFIVSFDARPRIAHPRSKNVATLRNAVFNLVPAGGTSIFDAVTFALQQFQGISGKKALIVFSDGLEGTSTASARECERLARSMGIPIYLVIPPGSHRFGHALRGISELTGGTIFSAPEESEMPAVFDDLAKELAGLYVLTFPRPAEVKAGAWRAVKVTSGRGTVRTVQGYRAN